MATSPNLLRHLPSMKNTMEIVEVTTAKKSTITAYTNNLKYLSEFMADNHHSDELPLPASLVYSYAFAMAEQGKAYNTIRQRLSAISWLHEVCGFKPKENPVLAPELHQIGRKVRAARIHNGLHNNLRQKKPLRPVEIRKLCRKCDTTRKTGTRNKAMILIGFAGALRRSELVSLAVTDIEIASDQGSATIRIRTSKADHNSTGQTVSIHASKDKRYCPIACLLQWLELSDITTGVLFPAIINNHIYNRAITGAAFANTLKALCKSAGLNESDYAGHSLRRGLLTSAAESGKGLVQLRDHARHTESSMTEKYIGSAVFKKGNPTKGIL